MDDVVELIRNRRSSRGPFDPSKPIPPDQLRTILEAARWSPTAHNMQNFEIVVVQDRKLLKTLAEIPGSVSEVFIKENYAQLSFSEEELRKKKVGILGTMFPPSWRNPDGPRTAEDDERPSQAQMAEQSAALFVVLYDPSRRAPASEGDFLGIVSLGCVMQNMWLAAASCGIGLQILSSFTANEVETEVKRILGIPAHLSVAFTARVGYSTSSRPYLRVRRDIEDFVHEDRYGTRYASGGVSA